MPAGSKWTVRGSSSFQYKDRDALSDGVTRVKLSARSGGRASVLVKAAGAGLPLSAASLPEGATVTTQLVNSNLECWEGR